MRGPTGQGFLSAHAAGGCMTQPANHWKLGLFIVSGLFLVLSAVLYFGSRALTKETVTCHSYFDEAVTGLEVGSPTKFRGVTIGHVSQIQVAPDLRHVEIDYEIERNALERLGIVRKG